MTYKDDWDTLTSRPEPLVVVSGGFDPVHIGHIRLFKGASELGLVVAIINRDEFLMKKKGFVFMPLLERAEIIASIRYVYKVFLAIDEDMTVCESLAAVKPDIFANGGDRKDIKDIPEAKVCKDLGIEMVFGVGGDKVQSSSNLVGDVARSG